jgi:hypothetical protein
MAKSVCEKPLLIAFLGNVGPPPYLRTHFESQKRSVPNIKSKAAQFCFEKGNC